ncbi:MAG: mitofilin family membrane protein, partial [Pseudomonadota bacterium]
DAEPVAMAKKAKEDSKKPAQPSDMAAKPKPTGDTPPKEPARATPASTPGGSRSGAGLISGVAGGVLALIGAAGLQWVGVLPNLGSSSVDFTPVQTEIAALSEQVDALAAEETPDQAAALDGLEQRLAALETSVDAGGDAVAPLAARIDEITETLTQLTTAVESGEAGDGAAVETLAARLSGVDEQLGALAGDLAAISAADGLSADIGPLQERLATMESQSAAMTARVDEATRELGALRSELGDTLTALGGRVDSIDGQLSSLAEQVAAGGADSSAVARAFAASSLKNAVDRGGSFASELEAFATVGEGDDLQAVETLRNFAASGVPTRAQLIEQYPQAANAIIASERALDPDAGLAERLVNNMQGLISVRPVDEQEGTTATAVSTRIGARLGDGDLTAAIAEWEALPEAAQAASSDFIEQLRARQAVDQLISGILAGAMSGAPAPAQ